jgi:CheY-like chemotaxis protein
MNTAPVLIVSDDQDDKDLILEAWKELNYPNVLLFLKSGEEVIGYLEKEQPAPFLILCDVNLPRMDSFELKERILSNTRSNYKSIPFVFWSALASKAQIQKSYDLGGNGFFIKDQTFEGLKKSLVDIVEYWRKSLVPAE